MRDPLREVTQFLEGTGRESRSPGVPLVREHRVTHGGSPFAVKVTKKAAGSGETIGNFSRTAPQPKLERILLPVRRRLWVTGRTNVPASGRSEVGN